MNLQKLFEQQKILDDRINREHPPKEGEDRLNKKILALHAEVGELANELPEVFKFWSNKKNNMERALKEYVDCLHFILSIGLELNIASNIELESMPDVDESPVSQFIEINFYISSLPVAANERGAWLLITNLFIGLGEMLGFTWEEIEQAYVSKNEVNHQRQEEGY